MKMVNGVNGAYCLSKTNSSEELQDSLEWGNTAVLPAAAQSLFSARKALEGELSL